MPTYDLNTFVRTHHPDPDPTPATVVPADRFGNLVPFSPFTNDTLERWHEIVTVDVTYTVARGYDDLGVRMSSVYGSGEVVPLRDAAQVALDLDAARLARTLGNERVYGAEAGNTWRQR